MTTFNFELDDIDAENLFSIMNRNRMKCFERLIDGVHDKDDPPSASTVRCLIDQLRYSEELMDKVFGVQTITPLDLSRVDNYL